jgi:hypothetical protein
MRTDEIIIRNTHKSGLHASSFLADVSKTQVHFYIEGSRRLFIHDNIFSRETCLAYLGHRILANAADLRSHTQRIFLLFTDSEPDELQGAMVDLFIALGSKGCALKRHLLSFVGSRLPPEMQAWLARHVNTGFQPWDSVISHVKTSILSLGYSGVHDVVHRVVQQGGQDYTNAIEEANDCLEYGQVDRAREVLEHALWLTPGNLEIATELLEIYRRTKNFKNFSNMRDFLVKTLPTLPAGWHEVNDW